MATDYSNRLTIRTQGDIDALEPGAQRYRAWDAVVKGLSVRVQTTGVKSWFFEYRDAGGKRDLQLARVGGLGVRGAQCGADAREYVHHCRVGEQLPSHSPYGGASVEQ